MRSRTSLIVALLSTAIAAPALAETNADLSNQTVEGPSGQDAEQPVVAAPPARRAFNTGVAKGRDLLNTAISASVIDEDALEQISANSVVGIMQNIPGLRAETSDIDGFSATTVRGLPLAADGSKFLQLQEDGLPVLEFGDIHFASVDQFMRADLSLAQVQAIRGGSASTFASNAPGGVVNFISKTGETEGGTLQISSGLGYDLNRLDFSYGSPLGDGWRFHVGGFYRQGEGPRDIGYDAFRGGQIKLNVTKQLENGYIRIYGKYLDDRQPNYSLYPVLISGTNENPTISDLPGNSYQNHAYQSAITQEYLGVDQNNNPTVYDASNGLRGKTSSLGLEAQFDVAGFSVTNRFRFAAISGEYNENIPMVTAPSFALAGLLVGPGATFAYAGGPNAGDPIVDGRLLALSIRINAQLNNLDNATNDLRVSRVWELGSSKLTTTAGVYAAKQSIDMYWNFQNSLNDLAGGGANAPVDLTSADGTRLSDNGAYGYGFAFGVPISTYHTRYDLQYDILAPYGSVNLNFGKLALGASLRWDRGDVEGNVYKAEYGGGRVGTAALDVDGDGIITAVEQQVAILPLGQPALVGYDYDYVSYSVSANYRVAEPLSVFARYSRGGRANAERILGAGSLNPDTGALADPSIAYGIVKQAEVGLKFRTDGLAAYVTGFWASTGESNFQIGADDSGQVVVIPVNRTYSAKGIEFEGEVQRGPFALAVGATYTKAQIDEDNNDSSLVGNTPRHIPDFAFFARPTFNLDKLTVGTVVNGTTESYAQDSNILVQPGYVLVSPFVQYRPVERVTLALNAFNVLDSQPIVQLASAIIPPSGIINAQVMNGRTVTASLSYEF
ncbi:TonB-dependent receptor domain-containing protein [Aurantiacibacter suaedae]|uniref:TonB-dependent receptor domain-containing protein n=1 Tax=Aurantiacibacter suaedae TaxID=2545755 RepID=UPI0010FA561A|nr:TonB-dependent receptor [Aurantiacibacter suaedae]